MATTTTGQRNYQYGFSSKGTAMYDEEGRQRKAYTMIAVLQDYFKCETTSLSLLNIGGSTGIIDSYLAQHTQSVTSIDIDAPAIDYAQKNFSSEKLQFTVGDAMNLTYSDDSFDIVICSQVYEHVPDSEKMLQEIHRVLKPGGVCYFAAGNRLMWNEPHYNLPLLSVMPRPMADLYMRLAGKGEFYYEKHLTYWGLKHLTRNFKRHDYTAKMLNSPKQYGIDYMIDSTSIKGKIAKFLSRNFIWLVPGYIWVLEK